MGGWGLPEEYAPAFAALLAGTIVIALFVIWHELITRYRFHLENRKHQAELAIKNSALAQCESKVAELSNDLTEQKTLLRQSADKIEELRPYWTKHQRISDNLNEMYRVWIKGEGNPGIETDEKEQPDNGPIYESDAHKLLKDNLWVLLPEYALAKDGITSDRWMTTNFDTHFPEKADGYDWEGRNEKFRAKIKRSYRPDLCGWTRDRKILVIIELKHPDIALTWDHLEQVHAYAFSFIQHTWDKSKPMRIDCIVIGNHTNDVNGAYLRWGNDANHAIRIIPMSYTELYARAERMAQQFLVSKPSPFPEAAQ